MADIDKQIRDRINSFVYELTELVRRAALDTISDALGSDGYPAAAREPGRPRGGRGAKAAAPALRPSGGRAGKRSADEIEATATNVLAHVRSNPGEGVEQISHALGIASRDLTLPIRKLVSTGRLSTQGHKRATKYFIAGEGPGGSRRKAGKKKKKASKRGGRAR
jgi:hypothetical protein